MGVLDNLNTSPVYTGLIPSTGKKFKYRSYNVAEEQRLLMAKESKDTDMMLMNIKELIDACTFGDINPDELATFDVEYLFVLLRIKSVGEEVDIKLPCKSCEKLNDVQIDLNDVSAPVVKKKANIVELDDNLHVIMRYPGFGVVDTMRSDDSDFFDVIGSLVESIVAGDVVHDRDTIKDAEIVDFIKKLNTITLQKIMQFFKDMPNLNHTVKNSCLHCKEKNEYNIKGLNNFFG